MLPRGDKSSLSGQNKCNCNKSAIIFLQRKQTEILSDLHQEIAMLKRENSDLKFKLFTKSTDESESRRGYREQVRAHSQSVSPNAGMESKVKISKLAKELKDANFRVNSLEKMLASMDKMVGDSTFLQVQAETQFKVQQIEIEALQKELEDLRMVEFKIIHPSDRNSRFLRSVESISNPLKSNTRNKMKASKKQCHTSRLSYEDEKLMKAEWEHRRRSLSTSSSKPKARRSSLSILPINYKETVATLPPIQFLRSNTSNGHVTTQPNGTKGIPLPVNNNYTNLKSSSTPPTGVGWHIGNLGLKKALS